jgi:hypothetical protein
LEKHEASPTSESVASAPAAPSVPSRRKPIFQGRRRNPAGSNSSSTPAPAEPSDNASAAPETLSTAAPAKADTGMSLNRSLQRD